MFASSGTAFCLSAISSKTCFPGRRTPCTTFLLIAFRFVCSIKHLFRAAGLIPNGFYLYYMNNGVLHYTMEETTTSISIVIGDKTLTLCGINNQQNLVLNKKE